MLYRERKRKKIPSYIRLIPTSLCFIAGFALDWFTEWYPTVSIGCALGLLFADYFMFRRLSCIDPESGLYNRNYLPVLEKAAKEKNITTVTLIRFTVREKSERMARILKEWEPEFSKILNMGDGRFLVVAEPLRAPVIKSFVSFVTEQAKSEGIQAEVSYEEKLSSSVLPVSSSAR